MIELDRVTRRLIDTLQRKGRQSAQQLAEAVGMSATPVWRRLKELEQSGVIRREVVLMDREKLGLAICAWAYVSLVRHTDGAVEDFERLVASSPEIMECASITGEADYVIKVVVPDMKAYDRFLQERLFKLKGVASIRTNVVLREVKYETALPLPPG
ncbi:Lrp/AsnC family transcriptional regulator [Ideonella sp.]|jgi:Lrp/AsnC family transcriptional regulator, leucine-responsive regulatory protein|uniref:Lrp/AsnC family transcriptional regulator n=1 Tax=Ideonella sp. TaxID=1929293 RepID=UPI0039C8B823